MAAASVGPGPHIYAAISQVIKLISKEGISKDRKNQQQGYMFRGIDDVYNAVAPLIADAGICIMPRYSEREIIERETKGGGALFNVNIKGDFDFVSSFDGSKHLCTMYGEAMDTADKATNKAMSAAYKYACMQVFCIPTEGQNDADATTPDPGKRKAAPVSAPAPAQVAAPKPAPAPATRAQAPAAPAPVAKPAAAKKPWSTFGEMLEVFSTMGREVGEKTYFGTLSVYGVKQAKEFAGVKNPTETALKCYEALLDHRRRQEAA